MKKHLFFLVLSMLTFTLAINGQTRYSYSDDDVYCHSRVVEVYEGRQQQPAMRVLPGGKVTQEDVVQYDTKYLNVHHRQKVVRRDIYDNCETEYYQQNEYTVPRRQEYESNSYVEEIDVPSTHYKRNDSFDNIDESPIGSRNERTYRKYTCYERLGLNYIEGATWTVNFNMDSYAIPYSAYTNGVNIRDFAYTHPDVKFDLYGSADIGTGTAEYNTQLANKRNEAVRKLLIRNYGISPNRIRTHVLEPGNQIYSINDWNRCVIIKASIKR